MEEKMNLPDQVVTSLSAHISKCFSEAETAKRDINERLLSCERQRKGEYEPMLKAQIQQTGGQLIFMMITDIKCRAADAWIKDVMQNHDESTWSLTPTVEPELPPEMEQEVHQVVMQEAVALAQQGIEVLPETVKMREEQLLKETDLKIKEIAHDKAKRMETRITDKLQEGGFRTALAELIYDFTTYPSVFMKGPIFRKKKKLRWGENFEPIVEEQVVLEVERISPYDIYPSPQAVSIQDGYLIHRHKLSRVALREMKGMKGADSEAIEDCLKKFKTGYRSINDTDSERDHLQDRNHHFGADGLIEALEYWGPASGYMLKEWGLVSIGGERVKEEQEYQINAWKVADTIVRAVINPDPLGMRPYSKASFEDRPGAFWGIALPEMMADVQLICNAAARALANNMGIASGPQIEVSVDRLPPGEPITRMFPWKIWQTTSDRTGGGQPAIRFFQPEMRAQELLGIYSHFSRVADEVTGVPNYIYGSSNVSGAGRTASGLSMLMENAAKGIKHAILNLDGAVAELIRRIYVHLMMFDPDDSIKGDMHLVASGTIGAMIRAQQQIALREFMASTLNPFDAQIIGPAGRAHMLREAARGIFPDIDQVVPDPQKMMAAMQAQAEMQAGMQGPQGPGGPPPPDQAAPPDAGMPPPA